MRQQELGLHFLNFPSSIPGKLFDGRSQQVKYPSTEASCDMGDMHVLLGFLGAQTGSCCVFLSV